MIRPETTMTGTTSQPVTTWTTMEIANSLMPRSMNLMRMPETAIRPRTELP